MCDAPWAFELDDAHGETAVSSDNLRSVVSANAAAVFILVPSNDIVATVLDPPMSSVDAKTTFGLGLFRSSAGNAVGNFR